MFRALADREAVAEFVVADSAGIGDWHVGEDMDRRSRATLTAAGYAVDGHSAAQFSVGLFEDRDVIVALDAGHLADLRRLAAAAEDPVGARAKLVLLGDFDAARPPGEDASVPDPYYGGDRGFRDVLAQIERSCAGLLAAVVESARSGRALAQQTERPPR